MSGRHMLQCVRWSIKNTCIRLDEMRRLERHSQSWQQYYTTGNDMGVYEPPREAEYSSYSQDVF